MKVHADVTQIGSYRRTQLLALFESVQDLVIASGRMTEAQLKGHMSAVSEHLADSRTTLIDKLIVQAWGQKAN